ncbi:signal recognition particle protein Srp19, partial [Candidatus Micrarchaeota archaeon CG_4_10_14_0_2_um_filter_60_11]
TGVIVTKMDGSGKGGGALSSVAVSGAKIAFIGTGEKMADLEAFDAEAFVGSLVGFPNIGALLEKAREASDEQVLEKAMSDGKLDFDSFLAQMRTMRKMGPLKQVMQMLGVYDLPEEVVGQSEEKLKQFEAAVLSMTPAERKNPDLMKQKARQQRVAKGAGIKEDEVKQLLQNFERASKMMKSLGRNRGFLKGIGKRFPGLAGMK